jgi:hypothetical protein
MPIANAAPPQNVDACVAGLPRRRARRDPAELDQDLEDGLDDELEQDLGDQEPEDLVHRLGVT